MVRYTSDGLVALSRATTISGRGVRIRSRKLFNVGASWRWSLLLSRQTKAIDSVYMACTHAAHPS